MIPTSAQIAKALEEMANAPLEMGVRAIILIGSVRIRCDNTREAILKVASKYRKNNVPRGTYQDRKKVNPIKRVYSSEVFKRFARNGETANAVQYAIASGKPVYFGAATPPVVLVSCEPIQDKPDFVIGRSYGVSGISNWNVFHIPTGLTCSSNETTKVLALQKFNNISFDTLQEGIKRSADRNNFYKKTITKYLDDED